MPIWSQLQYDYEVSLSSNSGFATSVSIAPVNSAVATTTVYVRLKAGLSSGSYNSESIVVSSIGASNQTITVNGTISLRPTTYTENFTTSSLSATYNTTTFTTNLGTWSSGGGGCGLSTTGIFGNTIK
jgi:hypothetical protein